MSETAVKPTPGPATQRLNGLVGLAWATVILAAIACGIAYATAPRPVTGGCLYDCARQLGTFYAVAGISSAIVSLVASFAIVASGVRLGILAADEVRKARAE